ncbi:MAG: hypothetical protein JW840_09055 [Candidatus Thermoplasmatota archaeon]|nr:hypothetical protein [Candidatus Thermoplasmatota archaeon]
MEKKALLTKTVACGIILLFIGVTVAPSINHSVAIASQDHTVVNVTAQACGIKGFHDTTVELTTEQYQNLKQYLMEFKARWNQTATREEAIPLFKEAVVKLDTYGLLPQGMSVEQALNLLLGTSHYEKVLSWTNKLPVSYPMNSNENISRFCLIAGHSSNTYFIPFSSVADYLIFVFMVLSSQSYAAYNSQLLSLFFFGLSILFCGIYILALYAGNIIPFSFLDCICFGYKDTKNGYDFVPAQGWVKTIGIHGVKAWNQSFWGTLENPLIDRSNIGVIGFSGIKLVIGGKLFVDSDFMYLGSALWVNIDGE